MEGKIHLSSDIVKLFNGEGDLMALLVKVKLVSRLQKVLELASFIPLFLERYALALYLQLSDEDQRNADKIEAKLKMEFIEGALSAYEKLGRMRWTGEASNIQRLAKLAWFEGSGHDQIVKLTFVYGIPESISMALQQLPNVKVLEISELISTARVLTPKRTQEVTLAAKPGIRKEPEKKTGYKGRASRLVANASIVGVYTWSESVKSQLEQFAMDVANWDTLWDIVCRETKWNWCASSYLFKTVMAHDGSLLTIRLLLEGKEARALVDTRCTTTLIHSDFWNGCKGTSS